MFTRPDGLTDADIVRSLADGWGITARTVEWAPVGFGSHHWHVTSGFARRFVTGDDLDARRLGASDTRARAAERLAAALTKPRSASSVSKYPTSASFPSSPIATTKRQDQSAFTPSVDVPTWSTSARSSCTRSVRTPWPWRCSRC